MSKSFLNRFALLLFVAMASGGLWAQIPNGYYNNAEGKTGDELKVALHNIIKGHHEVSYGGLLNAFAYTDCKPNGKIWDIYSNIEYSLTTGLCGEYEQEGDCWNREHTWPQSWFNDQNTPRCDLFHVYPTDGYVNGRRGNLPYGEVNNPSYTSGNGSKLGPCVTSGYSGTVFEPIDEYKGDIARSYFYMSVRYYSEDDSWSTSNMTNKSEILPWAMTMLLRWSDEDPVSEKEINRNNAVYGYQGNRNPFIDHPEYAHIIWEPGWSGTPYAITCATGLSNGSILAPSTAIAGTIVTLTATPNPGYELDTWTVTKTGDASAIITVSNNTFVMPNYPVTVSATFKVNNTLYNITQGSVSHGSFTVSATTAKSGTTITLSAYPATGYSLYAWYVYKTADINTHVSVSTSGNTGTFTMPAYDVTVLATFAQGSGGGYEKVTSAQNDWSGVYLIVYEGGSKAFDGSLAVLDAVNNNIGVSIANQTIAITPTTEAAEFTIAKSGQNYTIKSASGYYIGQTSDANGLAASLTQAYLNTISYNTSESSINVIGSGGAYLRFNVASNQMRFRYFKSSTYTGQKAIQLYKKINSSASIPTHTIQFNPNGGSQSSYTQTVNEFDPTALQANTFTRQGYAFDRWNTAADGSGTTYFDGAIVTLLEDLTLYAQWVPTYTITCASVEHGSISASANEAIEGATINLTATPADGYDLEYWMVTAENNEPVEVEGNWFVMPASHVTVSATFAYVGQSYTQKYYLVTDESQLVEGRTYLVVCTSKNRAMAGQSGYARTYKTVTISNNTIQNINGASELILGRSADLWTLWDGTGYLCAGSSTNNQLLTQTELDNEGRWTITFNANYESAIVAQGNYTHRNLKYSSGAQTFGCFESGATAVSLFVRSEEYDYTESATVPCLNTFDKITIRSGVTLTASKVLGASMCNNALQFVLEDGARLMHTETGINATMKKTIMAYSDDGGWYTLGIPFATLMPSVSNGLLPDSYDLYYYNESGDSQGKEWINYEPGAFSMTSGKGYLYANSVSRSLRMGGTLNSGSYSQTVNLGYTNSNADLKGYNLLGNPTMHEIEFTKTGNVSDGYYYLSNSGNWVYETGNTVPVGRGFLVKANAASQSVTLNPQSKGVSEEEGQYVCLSVGEEKVYIKLNKGVSMPLLDLGGEHTSLYLTHEGKPYVMLVRDGASTLDLGFVANGCGEHTLTVDTKGLPLGYLHLVDRLTNADVDLLMTPSYSFTSTSDDHAMRFQLRFVP